MRKSTPQIEVKVQPRSAIPRRQVDSFVVADVLADVLLPASATAGVTVRGNSGGNWQDWNGVGNGLKLNGVGFARFLDDGSAVFSPGHPGQGSGGFYPLPLEVPYDCSVKKEDDAPAPTSSGPEKSTSALPWIALNGEWETVPALKPVYGGGSGAIYNTTSPGVFKIRTENALPANIALRFDLDFLGQNLDGPQPGFRLRFGEDLSITMRHGMPPALELESVSKEGARTWTVVKTMTEAGSCDLHGGKYQLSLRHLDGRMIWTLNDHALWLSRASKPDKEGQFEARDWNWGEAPLVVSTQNTKVRLECARHDFKRDQIATVTRKVPRNLNSNLTERDIIPVAGGWQRFGTQIPIEVTLTDESIDYTAQLKPTPDGVMAPFLRQIMLSWAPVWTNPVGDGIDISRAVGGASLTLAAPPTQAGAQGSLDVDRVLLRSIPGALDNLQDYCPIEIKAQWRSSDGAPQGWSRLFKGYIYGQTRGTNAFNNQTLSLTLRDDIVRLTAPSALIDHKFKPLGMILLERLAVAAGNHGYNEDGHLVFNPQRGSSQGLYSGDCVQEIIATQLGPAAASSLNGNGDNRRFFPRSQVPLWSLGDTLGSYLPVAAAFEQPLGSGNLDDGVPFAPPFGDDCLSWINKFAQDDVADFFVGLVDRNAWPTLIYGRYLNYLEHALLWDIHDTIGDAIGDLDYLMSEAASETRPESDINRILVWADFPGGQKNPFAPAMRMAEARLPGSDFNSDQYTWQRTKLIKNNLATVQGGAELYAAMALQQIAGLRKQWPTLTFRGEGGVVVGDVLRPILESPGSDPSLGINRRIFRTTSVTHKFTFSEVLADWTTSAGMRPLAKNEEMRFRQNHSLEAVGSYFG